MPAGDDLCEVDKFDQMMVRLQSIHKGFYQVVALDKAGSALTRTWVVAEIAQAQRDTLKQKIQTFFPLRLSRREIVDGILRIDVRRSEASNPADTAMILAKIDDKDAYNESVRRALLQSIRPSALHMCALVLVAVLGVAFLGFVLLFTFAFPDSHLCTRHDCEGRVVFAVPITFAICLIVSHVEYGSICADIRASEGLRHAALCEADSASGAGRCGILWGLQRWYARQSAGWDSTDPEVLPRETRPSKASVCRWSFDISVIVVLRLLVLIWSGSSLAVAKDAFDVDPVLIIDPLCTFPVVAIIVYYDPAVRQRSVEGLVFLALLATVYSIWPSALLSELLAGLLVLPLCGLSCALCGLCCHRAPCCAGQARVGPDPQCVGRPLDTQATVQVQVPQEVLPGEALEVTTPAGHAIQVAVLPHAVAGSFITVPVHTA